MSVSHLASSESHTASLPSASEASFTWNHTPGGTARGVSVAVWTNGNAGVTLALGVTYGGVTVPAVTGGEAARTPPGEQGNIKVFHLGTGIPATSPAAVVVTRTNNAVEMWACCVTQSANIDTEVYSAGIALAEGAAALIEHPADDGSPGSNSLRYAAGHFGYDAIPPAGANSTDLHSIDLGASTASMVRETTAGQGSRSVGFVNVASDEQAIVHFAVREMLGGVVHLASSESHPGTTGNTFADSFTWNHTPGGPANGVTVFVITNGNVGVGLSTGVTYDGVPVPAIPGAEASRTVGEAGNCKVYHLGVGVPATSPAAVVVSRTNNAVMMYAVCCTQIATKDTEVFLDTITLRMGAGGALEVSIYDGDPARNSLRYAGGFFGNDVVPTVGANSTALQSIDMGATTALVVRESTPGTGSRLVGIDDATAATKAVVHFAIRELIGVITDLFVVVYGSMFPQSPIGELPTPGTALTKSLAEGLHIGPEIYSVIRFGPSTLIFFASPNHASVTDYKAQLFTYPAETLAGTLSLGVPTPDAFGHIAVDLAALYAGKAAGEYTVWILTETASGSAPSEMSDVFTLPLI